MLVPNDNYCDFEDFLLPLVKEFNQKVVQEGYNLTPSKLIREMGRLINCEKSIYYWCYKNEIPVFCPGITDGAIGDVFFF
jgi:deoxyhypusine synthase